MFEFVGKVEDGAEGSAFMRYLGDRGEFEVGGEVVFDVLPLYNFCVALGDLVVYLLVECLCCVLLARGRVRSSSKCCNDFVAGPVTATIYRASVFRKIQKHFRGRMEQSWSSRPHEAMILTRFLLNRDIGGDVWI